MLNRPTVLAVTLAPMKEALQAYGVDFVALAHRAGIDPDLLPRPHARYPASSMQKLWRLAAEASGDPHFGLRVGSLARPGMFHALGLGIVSSSNVLAALQRIARYSSVVSTNGRVVLIQHDELVESRDAGRTEISVMPTSHTLDALVVALCRLLVLCGGPSAVPVRVRLPRPPTAPVEAYSEAVGCPVEFGAANVAIVFDAQVAAQPVFSGNPDLAAEADRMSARYIAGLRTRLGGRTCPGVIAEGHAVGRTRPGRRRPGTAPERKHPAAPSARRRHELSAPAGCDAPGTGARLSEGGTPQPRRHHVPAGVRRPEQFHSRVPTLDRKDSSAVRALVAAVLAELQNEP